nr:hypothetical protein StreXyl84_61560 [Streptomyces sp. Xyl84]
MPIDQHINWTVLPAGLSDDGTQARVSVFVAPRLTPPGDPPAEGTLGQFEDFLHWPDKVAAATFRFAAESGTPATTTVFADGLVPQGPAPDPTLWASVFPAGTRLEPHTFSTPETSSREVRSYSVAEVRDLTKRTYAGAGRMWPDRPPPTWGALKPQSPAPKSSQEVASGKAAAPQPPALPQLDSLARFHSNTPLETVAAGTDGDGPQPVTAKRPDFHELLTHLGDHPALLRRLGIVLDFLLPADRLPVSSGERLLTVVPLWPPGPRPDPHDVSSRTRYVFLPDRHVFVPAARSAAPGDPLPPPSRGLVALGALEETGDPQFLLEQTDFDSAALGMLAATKDSVGLGPVRAPGISLFRNQHLSVLTGDFTRAGEQDKAFANMLAKNNPEVAAPDGLPPDADAAGPELFAEDVVRGYRMDIWDDRRHAWFSLHERDVEYRAPGSGPLLFTASDEGFFQEHLVSSRDDSTLYVPEQLATWDGWALGAPRPGLVLDTEPDEPGKPPKPPMPPKNDAGPGVPLEITIRARPGSLPRLRFGTGYRVRLRTVDLAGNGIDAPQATALTDPPQPAPTDPKDLTIPAAGPLPFQRFEPVLSPAVVPRLPFQEGASPYRMVIRSSPGPTPPPAGTPGAPPAAQPVLLSRVQFRLTDDDVRTVQQALIADGHALPGGADGFFGDMTRAAYAEEQRAQGFSGSDADGRPGCQSLTELGRKNGFTVDCGTGPPPADGTTAEEYAADFNRSPLVTAQGHAPYQGIDERHLVAPKASLECVERHGLLDEAIGSSDHGVQDAVYDLAVRESGSLSDVTGPDVQTAPVTSPSADPLHPPMTALHTGEQIELPYLPDPLSSGAVFHGLPGMPAGRPFFVPWNGAVWHRPESFRLRLAEGSGPPRFDDASRVLTVLLPKGAVAVVQVSSGIDLDEDVMGLAAWCRNTPMPAPGSGPEPRPADEVLALAAAGGHWMFTPGQELTLVHAVQKPLRTPVLALAQEPAPRPEKATAQHLTGTIALDEDSTGRIDLVAEWTEVTDAGPTGRDSRTMTAPVFGLLTARASRTGTPGTEPALLQDGVLSFSTRAAADKAVADKTPPLIEKHEFGDTRHRTVHYQPLAGSGFGDCFPAQFADPGRDDLTVRGAAQEYSVLSSARPTAPRLLYCMPTLSLEQDDGPSGTLVRRRRGGGVRVYLERPWFSSGDGELLGVVLGEPPGGDPDSVRDAWVTLMGRDPLHRSAPVVAPTAQMFTNAAGPPAKLSLPTPTGALPVTVVGFTPQFDAAEEGGRWFCDLELDTGDACLPFVRLALVRYQPESIPGAEISPVVLADVVRVLPDRELTVKPGRPLSVTVTGPSWDPTGAPPPVITAVLQRRHDTVTDEDLGWVTLDDTLTTLTSIDAESSHRPFYTGQVPVPPAGPGVPLRLLVVETEGIPADGRPPAPGPGSTPPPHPPGPVIYCDAVEVPPGTGGHDDHGDRQCGGDRDNRHDGPDGREDDGDDHGGDGRHGGFGRR